MAAAPPPIGAKQVFKEVLRTKSGKVALVLLVAILSLAVAMPFYAPYDVVKKWNMPQAWTDNPKCAAPEWVKYFTPQKEPEHLIFNFGSFHKYSRVMGGLVKYVVLTQRVDYDYDDFPPDFSIAICYNASENVLLNVTVKRPDGESICIIYETLQGKGYPLTKVYGSRYYNEMFLDPLEACEAFVERVTGEKPKANWPSIILFAEKGPDMSDPDKARVLKGTYVFMVILMSFDKNMDADAKLIIDGKVFGLAGTDEMGRDLLIAILWGAPVALAFGIIASVTVAFSQTFFGVLAGYFGGKTDAVICRIAEIMMIIPLFPILILVSFFYKVGVWDLILVILAFSIVGGMTLTIRSMVPSIKAEQYIEAAVAYGASKWRILFRHVLPRVLPYTFASIALSVPGYVFLEAALRYLGLGTPLPTWGEILAEAQAADAAYHGYWWWILMPAGCIFITAMAFALLGYAFDKVVNPRLREM